MEERNENVKRIAVPHIIELCLAGLILLAAAAYLVILGSSKVIALTILAGVWILLVRRSRKNVLPAADVWKYSIEHILVFLIVAYFVNAFPTLTMAGTGKWRYPFEKSYVERRHTCLMPDWFPDKLPDDAENCRMDYLPTIMQGGGLFSVGFECGEGTAAEWESFGKENAVYIVPLSEYAKADGEFFDPKGYEVSAQNAEQNDYPTLDVHYDKKLWQGSEDGAVIYVMYTNLNWNHPHTEAVIVSRNDGKVQLFTE